MPKNAVQRLQKIDNDIKTVLSIYDITNSLETKDEISNKANERKALLFSKINTAKCWDTSLLFDGLRDQTAESPFPTFESIRQSGTYIPPLEYGVLPRESPHPKKKSFLSRKPSSAPSSSSTLSTICESDYKWEQSSESNNGASGSSSALKAKRSDSLNLSEWIELNISPEECDSFMSPSKTILTANEVLAHNNYPERDAVSKVKNPVVRPPLAPYTLPTSHPRTDECVNKAKTKERVGNLGPDVRKRVRSKSPNADYRDASPKGLYSVSPTREAVQKSLERDSHLPVKAYGHNNFRVNQKAKTVPDIFPTLPTNSKKTQRTKKCSSPEPQSGMASRGRAKESVENHDKGSNREKKERNLVASRHERMSKSPPEKERKVNNEKKRNSSEINCSEIPVHELSKIIEKNNEKMEKMKVSKGLALDIAKQLKDKYDEMQQSKEELLEKLQTVEKDNERLNDEVKNAQQSSMKLQIKMEDFRKSSKTKLQEQEIKTAGILEENARLKIKITELEMQQNEKIIEKQNQIDQLKKERLSEIKNETNEKSELVAKIEGLQFELQERKAEAEAQEEKIRQLQEEFQKQQMHLKKKTERLEETNKELNSIRQNSNDLEEQVKALRKNIENFEDLHKNLMKQTVEYEHRVKLNQEEIIKLKSELENEKDALLIKTKIIEDQQATIRQLREKAEENKMLHKRNQSLERILNIEREEKLELQDAVERLKWRKEELKSRIKNLESDLLLAPQEVVKDLQKTQMVLHELENQVQIKQKEWELHLQALIKEKEQACSVAEFATKKLMQTTSEFQKQSEAHKRLHRVLAENLAEKECRLREAIEKLTEPEND